MWKSVTGVCHYNMPMPLSTPKILRGKSLKHPCTEYLVLIGNQTGTSILIPRNEKFYPLRFALINEVSTPRDLACEDFNIVGRVYEVEK